MILREHLDIICVGILDDIIIYSADTAKHVHHVRTILQILRDNKLYESTVLKRNGRKNVKRGYGRIYCIEKKIGRTTYEKGKKLIKMTKKNYGRATGPGLLGYLIWNAKIASLALERLRAGSQESSDVS